MSIIRWKFAMFLCLWHLTIFGRSTQQQQFKEENKITIKYFIHETILSYGWHTYTKERKYLNDPIHHEIRWIRNRWIVVHIIYQLIQLVYLSASRASRGLSHRTNSIGCRHHGYLYIHFQLPYRNTQLPHCKLFKIYSYNLFVDLDVTARNSPVVVASVVASQHRISLALLFASATAFTLFTVTLYSIHFKFSLILFSPNRCVRVIQTHRHQMPPKKNRWVIPELIDGCGR